MHRLFSNFFSNFLSNFLQTLLPQLLPQWSWLVLLRMFALVYGTLCAYAWFATDRQIYQPPQRSLPVIRGGVTLQTPSGTSLSALYFPVQKGRNFPTILYSHGNAEDLFSLQNFAAELHDRLGYGFLAYDYPGYGQSSGKPSEKTVYEAIDTAYTYLTQQQQIPPQKIIVYGRSLGGGPSVNLATHAPIGGLILESTFVSIFRVVTGVPLVPFDKFNNLSKIQQVKVPLLILHGTEDSVVPFWHGQALYQQAKAPVKSLEVVSGAGHNDLEETLGDRYWMVLKNFTTAIESP